MACLRFLSEPLTKEQFRAAQIGYKSPVIDLPLSSRAPPQSEDSNDFHPAMIMRRTPSLELEPPAFGQDQFETTFWDSEWYYDYPAVQKRNFYVIQKHYATAKHYDLRIQLDGKTVSFAIPKGLSDWPEDEKETRKQCRLAIETNPHPLNYTFYEGGGLGHTAVWDLGTYSIYRSLKSEQREEAELQDLKSRGFELDSTDDEEEEDNSDQDDEEDGPVALEIISEDRKQEKSFRQSFKYASFLIDPGEDAKRGKARSFVIELNGERYQGLRLTFFRKSTDFTYSRPKGTPKDQNIQVRKNNWLIKINSRPNSLGTENKDLGDVSLLTQRTMEEIEEDYPKQLAGLMQSGGRLERWGMEELREDFGEAF